MIQVDLEEMKKRFYAIGYNNAPMTPADIEQFKALDAWQRNEVLEYHKTGVTDFHAEILA